MRARLAGSAAGHGRSAARHVCRAAGLLALALCTACSDANPPPRAERDAADPIVRRYAAQVEPVLARKCFACHHRDAAAPWYASLPLVGPIVRRDMEWGAQRLDLSLPVPFAHSPWVGERAYLIALRTALLDDSMPPAAYLLLHPLHSLSSAEREAILGWVDAALERLEPGSAERDGDLSLAERTAGVLRDRCARCHNPDVDDEMNGEFDFVADLPFLVDDGEYVEPEDVEASKLWERIASREEPMPPSPNDRLDRAEKALVREWIEEGAPVDELRR